MMLSIADTFVEKTVLGASSINIEKIVRYNHQWRLTQVYADSVYQISRDWLPSKRRTWVK